MQQSDTVKKWPQKILMEFRVITYCLKLSLREAMVFVVVTACLMATHLLGLSKSYPKIPQWHGHPFQAASRIPIPKQVSCRDFSITIKATGEKPNSCITLLYHLSHKSFAGLWKLHDFLPMGRLNFPQDVFICTVSSAHCHSNSRHTKCIHKAANMSRIATTYHVPSKNKTLYPTNNQTVMPGTIFRCTRIIPVYASYLRQYCK